MAVLPDPSRFFRKGCGHETSVSADSNDTSAVGSASEESISSHSHPSLMEISGN